MKGCVFLMPYRRKPKLVTQYLEFIARAALEDHEDIIAKLAARRSGVYALYRRSKLYYAGLASELPRRLKQHLDDKHGKKWDSFSIYLTIGDAHLRELESLILRVMQPPGNTQLGKFAGAQDIEKVFDREIREKQRRERNRLLGRETEEAESRHVFARRHTLRAKVKGKVVRATLRKDGQVRWGGRLYKSVSAAATAARKSPTNGWNFWRYERSPGDWVAISELREG